MTATDAPWIHYSRWPLPPRPDYNGFVPEPCVKAIGWLHFARGAAWRDWSRDNLPHRGYRHRYELRNEHALLLFHIAPSTLPQLGELPYPLALRWRAFVEQGYDGVMIHRNALLADPTVSADWRLFASACEDDELVLFRNLELRELPLDVPRRNPRRACRGEPE